MKQNRQSKIVAILALCISILGLTLGFAAFSNTLTISSSATVSPNPSDFNINIYGVENWDDYHDFFNENLYISTTTSAPYIEGNAKEINPVKISANGNSITISDVLVEFIKPGDSINYHFLIRNEGQYDAYIDTSLFDKYLEGLDVKCTPGDDATPELVENACQLIWNSLLFMDSKGYNIESGTTYKLEKGDYIVLDILLLYVENSSVSRADGNFSVEFPDATIEFTSVPPVE